MKFKIGDKVRRVPSNNPLITRSDVVPVGSIGVITAGPFFSIRDNVTPGYWKVKGFPYKNTMTGQTHEDCLELVPPDSEQTIPWSQCVWKPVEVCV